VGHRDSQSRLAFLAGYLRRVAPCIHLHVEFVLACWTGNTHLRCGHGFFVPSNAVSVANFLMATIVTLQPSRSCTAPHAPTKCWKAHYPAGNKALSKINAVRTNATKPPVICAQQSRGDKVHSQTDCDTCVPTLLLLFRAARLAGRTANANTSLRH